MGTFMRVIHLFLFCIFLLGVESNELFKSVIRQLDDSETVAPTQKPVIEVFWPGMNISTMWEADYLRELFPYPYFSHTSEPSQPKNQQARFDLPRIGAIICGGGQHVNDIKEVYDALVNAEGTDHPKLVIIHISDEFMGGDGGHRACASVYDRASFVLRQYAYYGHKDEHTKPPHLYQIPLGYMAGMLGKFPDHKAGDTDEQKHFRFSSDIAESSISRDSSQRTYMWSFIGGKHGRGKDDREHAIEVWSQWNPHVVNQSLNTVVMKHIYDNSRFVVVGRGWHSIDCFRTYEAMIAGAIPVIVASDDEINRALGFEGLPGGKPPLIYSNSWEDALSVCQQMSNSAIDQQRRAVVTWYKEQIGFIQDRIQKLFDIPIKSINRA